MLKKLLRMFFPFFFKEDVNIVDNTRYPAKYEKDPDYLSGKTISMEPKKRGRPKKVVK